jgi:hypothetical protein
MMNELSVVNQDAGKKVIDSISQHNQKRVLKQVQGIRQDLMSIKNKIYEIGRRLSLLKEILPHGQFERFVEQEFSPFELPYPTAVAWKSLYDHWKDRPMMLLYVPITLLLMLKQKGFPEETIKRIESDPEGFGKIAHSRGVERIKRNLQKVQRGEMSEVEFWSDLVPPIKSAGFGKMDFMSSDGVTWEEQMRIINDTKQILRIGFSDIRHGIKAIKDCSELKRQTLNRARWLPPFKQYFNDEVGKYIRMLEEVRDAFNADFPDVKPISIIDLPKDQPPLQIAL